MNTGDSKTYQQTIIANFENLLGPWLHIFFLLLYKD